MASSLDYLTWAPGIAQLQEQVGLEDPSFRQAILDSLEVSEDQTYCQTLVNAFDILKYLVKKYLSIENITATVRKRLTTLRIPEDAYSSLCNITEIIKLIDILVLKNVLFVLDDSQLKFIERRAFRSSDLLEYRKLCQVHFSEGTHFSDDGSLDLRKLTVKCVQNAKLNKKRDFLLSYLRKHLAVLQSIQNNNGLKHPKSNVRKTVESQNFEISAENDCLEDPFCTQTTPD